ncbi:MAG: pectate lyase [Rikenellaceae bacterium]|nr:pectate lyase [Rikenellaceae bacterium]
MRIRFTEKIIIILFIFIFCYVNAIAGDYGRWGKFVERYPIEWYGTDEARAIADNVLVYQHSVGGWPKNIPMHMILADCEKDSIDLNGPGMSPTLDNDATALEMKFLAKVYSQTQDERYREAFERGLDYILTAQYDNGGWPQFYPLRNGYYSRITFNDDAMVNIMEILRDIYNEEELYSFVITEEIKTMARTAFDKGIDCILKTQIYIDGEPAVWCQQYDEVTLEPAKARSYELPSLCGGESVGIVRLLMQIPDPSEEIIKAVDGAVKWFDNHKIKGIRIERRKKGDLYDRVVIKDPAAPPIWARFYDLDTQKPFFCGRDGVKKDNLKDIEYERRNGYGWYTYRPQGILDAYPEWRKNLTK